MPKPILLYKQMIMEIEKKVRQNIAARIVELRNKRGLTQMQVADKLGIRYQNVGVLEQGRSMSLGRLIRLGNVLGFKIEITEI